MIRVLLVDDQALLPHPGARAPDSAYGASPIRPPHGERNAP